METIIRMLGFLGIGESALREAEVGRWPVLFGFDIKTDKGFRASNKNELLTGLRSVINQLERELAMQEQAVAEFRSGD